MLSWPLKIKQTKKIVIKRVIVLATFFLFAFFVLPGVLHAQTQTTREALGLTQIEEVTMLGAEDIRLTIAKIIRVLLGLLGIIVLSLMLYAGYMIMTSAGEADKVEKGKKILLNATVGLLIILSSFGIVQFVIMKLGQATGFSSRATGGEVARQTFLGSGSLGSIVKDHYPLRDQHDVPRNIRVSVTFNEALQASSVFNDSNLNGTLGDCINTALPSFNWNTDCDHLNTSAIKIYQLDEQGNNIGLPLDMVALASDEGGKFYTIVMRPVEPLGNDRDPVGYSVDLTNNIFKEDGATRMFDLARENHYKWVFYTGTEFDFTPPVVVSVYPMTANPTDTFSRNIVLQINFNEPMDPTATQGRAGSFSNILVNNMEAGAAAITGSWRITNGYTTVEFVSDQVCGENSCGEPMYCLPITCATANCSETHNAVARTAALISQSSWEALPFSGVIDMSGNALDGDRDGIQDGKPIPTGAVNILSNEGNPDNYLWNFEIANKIDRSAPYVREITPGIDAEDVVVDELTSIKFSKPMWIWTLSGINITEKIQSADVADLWYRKKAEVNPLDNTTLVRISHRAFGPNDEDAYYFTSIDSGVKSLNQNCVYPGRGPYSNVRGSSPVCVCAEDVNGVLTCGAGCIGVNNNALIDTGCVQTTNAGEILKGDIATCLSTMDTLSGF